MEQKLACNDMCLNNVGCKCSSTLVKFIDLFAGIGGTRIGFEDACREMNIQSECVLTSEIKEHAIDAYKKNFGEEIVHGDITNISIDDIPDFDYLLAGFPCQPFSSAGNRNGFLDSRGGLFFSIYKILKLKNPIGFLLENVDGLVTHDGGKTISVIVSHLLELGYKVAWKVLDSSEFGVAQRRKRVYIVGHKFMLPNLEGHTPCFKFAGEYIDEEKEFVPSGFAQRLQKKYTRTELFGKSIKDKRGGDNNIHSWDLELKGKVSETQKNILEQILKKRRNKKWAISKGIDWMDGMPLTKDEIKTFLDYPLLQYDLDTLTSYGYLRYEHPKKRIVENGVYKRVPKLEASKGYNIVAGKLSFPIVKILDPNCFVPTIVATEIGKIAVATKNGVRPISVEEGLRFSGFPTKYDLGMLDYNKAFDLIGNTVMPPVVKFIASKIL